MILDRIEGLRKYETLVPGISELVSRLWEMREKEAGRYEIGNGFYMIQKGVTGSLEDNLFETHEKYLDVQILTVGEELLEWESRDLLQCCQAYDEEKDLQLYRGKGTKMKITPGMCYILFPEDAHKACCHEVHETAYVKIVAKIRL